MRSSRRSSAATRGARRRTRASAATAASGSPSCSRSRSGPARSGSRPATTRGSWSTAVGCSWRARPIRARTSRTCSRDSIRVSSSGSGSRSASRPRTRRGPRRHGPDWRRPVAPESQEACFLAGDDYRAFLGRHGLSSSDGPIVDEEGRELGRHGGFWRFTPGQRKGLGVSGGEPLFALRSEPATNTVVVGPRQALATHEVEARGRLHVPVERVDAKLRYRSPAVAADVVAGDNGFSLRLDEPAYGVAPGQAAVLYEGDAVVGAGTIR